MSILQPLRNAHLLTRLVLVWFALFIGVALASPWLKSPSVEMVCSGVGGMKMVQIDGVGANEVAPPLQAHLDCPDCLPLMAPPAAISPVAFPPGGLAHVLLPLPSAQLASLLGQPWQARAPPVSFA
jgi:hypothetical protein